LEVEVDELLFVSVVLRQEEVPVEHEGDHAEDKGEGDHPCKDIQLIGISFLYLLVVSKLNDKTEDDFEHGEENQHQEDSAKDEGEYFISFVDLLLYLRRNNFLQF
jgi:hypothetical protein